VCEFVRVADKLGVRRPATIQNSFCLLHRAFETELAEACAPSNFNVGLLPWTPLAGGALSGKYLDGARPADARLTKYANFMQRYLNAPSVEATRKYAAIAEKAGVSLATLALAWCKTRFYVTSTIIGATNMKQLEEDIDAFDETKVKLSEETLEAIDAVHFARRDPCMIP
jgi:aryl-alcohol dehydrogenase-like predicted oxidoreductase